jgi:hypothetical protein
MGGVAFEIIKFTVVLQNFRQKRYKFTDATALAAFAESQALVSVWSPLNSMYYRLAAVV